MAAKTGTIRSTRELARAVGRSQPAVVKWLKHAAWSFGRGPWSAADIPAIKRWAADTLAPNPAAGDGLTPKRSGETPQNQLRMVQAARQTIRLAEDKKLVHRVDECEYRRRRQILTVKNRLSGEVDGLPLPPESIEVVRNWINGILMDFSQGNG